MTFEFPSCVTVEDQLIGFLGMPVEPFVGVCFQDGKLDQVAADEVDYIVDSPVSFSAGEVGSMVAVSEQLVYLFDRYGVVFRVNSMSECLTYKCSAGGFLAFRLLENTDLSYLWNRFLELLNFWFQAYAKSQTLVVVEEVRMMRALCNQFLNAAPHSRVPYLLHPDYKALLTYAFMEPEERIKLSAQETAAREQLMLRFGYHHVW